MAVRVGGEGEAGTSRVMGTWTEAQMVLACGHLDSYYHPEGDGGAYRAHLGKPFVEPLSMLLAYLFVLLWANKNK